MNFEYAHGALNPVDCVIETQNLFKQFRKLAALQGLNLNVPRGSTYALVGPNGAGKTTAIKILLNIIRATAGSASVLGLDSAQIQGNVFSRIGYVSENQRQPEWMRVGSFLDFLRPFYPSWDALLERDLVAQFELPLDRRLRHLSRGMKMKAVLASSLAYRPELIVLDEPFSGLDPLVRDQLIQSMAKRNWEATILVSSHDLAEVEAFATHVGYLDRGKLRFSEELTSLSERFREVEVSLDGPPVLPEPWPEQWMLAETTPTGVRFIESRFRPGETESAIRQMYGDACGFTLTRMSLRSIFLALAKSPGSMR